MRGRDPETGEFLGPSRTQQRGEALEIRSLAEKLVALPAAQLARLPIPEDLMPHIVETQRITSHIAHKRQLQFLAKQMRREEDEVLEAIRDAMDEGGDAARRETALLHRAEQWRDRLLTDGDQALADLLDEFPTADRQKLRQLVRNALDERAKNKPPRAFRELFREVRDVLSAADVRDTDEDDAP
ncbi:ribosome biogenesis factor YjgA [Pseudoxanthomonas sp.]|uniref:ribosome biogenesis factor YjgA n=1 Tax=Pseudoxanthomonas sp. TaxID=1871049 RepID=UPI002FE1B5C6